MKNDKFNLDQSKFTGVFVYAALALWFCFSLWMGAEGRFQGAPRQPPIALGLTFLLPLLAFVFAYTRRGSFWAFCQTLDLRFVVLAHIWRIMAIDFLLCGAERRLPLSFALPAGIGDIATALAAVPLAFALDRGASSLGKRFVAWNIFGLLDLVLAVSLGIMHSPSSIGILAGAGPTTQLMSQLPRCMVPTFLVPVFMLLHLLALARRHELVSTSTHEQHSRRRVALISASR
jgi:hypothetical protein